MNAAIDDVYHRHWKKPCRGAAHVSVKRQTIGRRRRLGHGKGHAQDGVGAEPGLVRRAVKCDQGFINLDLRFGLHAAERVHDLAIDRFDRGPHTLALIARFVAVSQFDGFMGAGRCARGHRGAAARAAGQDDVGLDGGIAARVEDLARGDFDDLGQASTTSTSTVGLPRLSNISRPIMSTIAVMRGPTRNRYESAHPPPVCLCRPQRRCGASTGSNRALSCLVERGPVEGKPAEPRSVDVALTPSAIKWPRTKEPKRSDND